jgi:hypothetical protein
MKEYCVAVTGTDFVPGLFSAGVWLCKNPEVKLKTPFHLSVPSAVIRRASRLPRFEKVRVVALVCSVIYGRFLPLSDQSYMSKIIPFQIYYPFIFLRKRIKNPESFRDWRIPPPQASVDRQGRCALPWFSLLRTIATGYVSHITMADCRRQIAFTNRKSNCFFAVLTWMM